MDSAQPKLPVQQLVILGICRLAEPVVLTSVLPYLPDMLEDVGIPDHSLGKWVGLAIACTSCAQGITAFLWGMLADSVGRKPVILLGLMSTMILTICFGLSKSLTQLLITRFLLGFMNGNVGVLRTMVAELVSEPSLQPRAYSILPLVFTIGCILGPSIGGGLARPADRFSSVFDDQWGFWRTYPYLLPNLVSACFFLAGIVAGFLFLQETLASRQDRTDYGLILGKRLCDLCRTERKPREADCGDPNVDEREPLLRATHGTDLPKPDPVVNKPTWKQVLSPQSNLVLVVYGLLGFHAMAFDTLLPVFLHLKVQSEHDNPSVRLPWKFSSGFGMNSQTIGLISTCVGFCGLPLQIWAFPRVAKRYGPLTCLRTASIVYPFLYLVVPFAALLPTFLQPVGICLLMFIKLAATTFAFPCCTIQLSNSAATLSVLGTLNGIATSVTSFGRAIGPAVVGTLFSLGVTCGYMIIPWWVLAGFSIPPIIALRWISDRRQAGS